MNTEHDRRWKLVLAHEARADGTFLYAVRSTGVYCRPSCPARRPRREQVAFYPNCAAAEAAGYRPCRRCRPDQARASHERIAAACRALEAALEDCGPPPSLAQLARKAGLSASHFHRQFRAAIGLTPRGYLAAVRAQRLRAVLPAAESVTEAGYAAGYSSSGRLYENAASALGMAPSSIRRGGAGETIRFGIGQSSLGAVLAAESDRGICAILLGEGRAALQRRFPRARIVPAGAEFAQRLKIVLALIESPARGLDLPLDLQGTAFQRRVWQALRSIPAGTTASYSEIARRIGAPRALRAVASACAANPLAVAVPCHRAVRKDAAPSGYRWGLARKRALLAAEASSKNR